MESETKEFFKGQYVDAQDIKKIWRPAQIVDIDSSNKLEIHFIGMGEQFDKENKGIDNVCSLRTHTIGFKYDEQIKVPPKFSKENFLLVTEKINKFIKLNSMDEIFKNYPKSSLLIQFLRGEVYFTLESILSSSDQLESLYGFLETYFNLLKHLVSLFPHYSLSTPSTHSLEGILKGTLMDLLEPLHRNWFFNSSSNFPLRHRLIRNVTNLPVCKHENPKQDYQMKYFQIIEKTKLIQGAFIGLVSQKNIEEEIAIIIREFLSQIVLSEYCTNKLWKEIGEQFKEALYKSLFELSKESREIFIETLNKVFRVHFQEQLEEKKEKDKKLDDQIIETSSEEVKGNDKMNKAGSSEGTLIKMNVNLHQLIFSYFTVFEQFTKFSKLCTRERNAMLMNKENPELSPRNLQLNLNVPNFWISIEEIKFIHDFSHHLTLKLSNSTTWELQFLQMIPKKFRDRGVSLLFINFNEALVKSFYFQSKLSVNPHSIILQGNQQQFLLNNSSQGIALQQLVLQSENLIVRGATISGDSSNMRTYHTANSKLEKLTILDSTDTYGNCLRFPFKNIELKRFSTQSSYFKLQSNALNELESLYIDSESRVDNTFISLAQISAFLQNQQNLEKVHVQLNSQTNAEAQIETFLVSLPNNVKHVTIDNIKLPNFELTQAIKVGFCRRFENLKFISNSLNVQDKNYLNYQSSTTEEINYQLNLIKQTCNNLKTQVVFKRYYSKLKELEITKIPDQNNAEGDEHEQNITKFTLIVKPSQSQLYQII